MDAVVTGVLSSLILKLGDVLVGEYKLQKGVKGEIWLLQPELESMHSALEEIENVPADQLDSQDKIWASDVRELSYDIEYSIDTFIVRCNDDREAPPGPHGMKTFIERSMDLLTRLHNRRKLAHDIKGIKRRLGEARGMRRMYKLEGAVAKPVTVDPRLPAHYTKVTEIIGIDHRRDELIKFLGECGDEVSTKKGKIVSIVGFGGLGKTTLANAVYVKMKEQFNTCAIVSVSQTPDMKKIFKGLLRDLGKNIQAEYTLLDEKRLIDELREFLEEKRYLLFIDDIWDISVWRMIRCALPDNKCGYAIITTTRIYDVANEAGDVYQMEPLSHRNSKILFYSRIFGREVKDNNDKCPYEQLVEVSDKILKKCAGVPLAIITIASLLASKGANKMEWSEVCSSIGVGLENSLDVENMRKILSFSYYGMPSYLRKCLLYFSVFPEDYEIDRNRLIRMWIAEDFIKCGNRGKSLFEIGESYFNELINKSMIQPVYRGTSACNTNEFVFCRIHDMILELVRSLSNEQNFVTIWNDVDQTFPLEKVIRRFCSHSSREDCIGSKTTMSMQKVRSIVVFFPPSINLMPPLRSLSVLRVLDLEHCNLSGAYSLEYLGNLFHLRYLGLKYTGVARLPEEIGNLKLLQTLDVSFTPTLSLPAAVSELKHLTSLLVGELLGARLPSWIGRLTSLEELSRISIVDNSSSILEELGNLTKLRVLGVDWSTEWDDSLENRLVECLNKLQKIQHLTIMWPHYFEVKGSLDGWVAPPHLSTLKLICWLPRIPNWMNPSLRYLWFLRIQVREVRQEDLQILGRLPALRYLYLWAGHLRLRITRSFVVDACSSPCLVECNLLAFGGLVEFQKGAMPRVEKLCVHEFPVREARGMGGSDGGLDFGLGHLQSLQRLDLFLTYRDSSEEAEKAKAAVTHTMEIHPNHPYFEIDLDHYI
ncbi:hypothetical protein U9M48_005516 [Paspalum notatum var. saurae]|uniref:Uncharacterized protein n=1 Tax=Paspalum notatum var. saurae TaxID=547442 RepID=A0AAQ3SLF1_PASNO